MFDINNYFVSSKNINSRYQEFNSIFNMLHLLFLRSKIVFLISLTE